CRGRRSLGGSDTPRSAGGRGDRGAPCGVWPAPPRPPSARASAILLALMPLDALEQGAEIAGSEALVALAMNDFEEEGPRLGASIHLGRVLHEDLQQIGVVAGTVDQDLELAQGLDVFVDAADAQALEPLGQRVVVGSRRGHELDAPRAQASD